MANNDVRVDFLSKDEVTKTLKKIEGGVGKLTTTVNKQTKKQKKSWLSLSSAVNTAFGFTMANVLQSTTTVMKDFVAQGVTAAVDMERQMQALEVQIGSLSDTILTDLKRATNSMVSDLELAKATNRALALGLQQDKLPQLFEVAAARAKVMGISVSQATNDIVTGIGRASPLILDNLGIVFSAEETYTAYAESVNKTVESLSKAEKALALQNAVIESSQGIVASFQARTETLADRLERMRTKVDNLQLSIGTLVTRSMVGWSIAFETTEDHLQRLDPLLIRYRQQIMDSTTEVEKLSQSVGSLESKLSGLQSALSGLAGQETSAQVEAQREVNKLAVEELQLRQEMNKLRTQDLNDIQKVTLANGEQLYLSVDQLQNRIDKLTDEKQVHLDIIQLEEARKKVILDEGIVSAEDQGLLEKNKTTLDTIQTQISNKLIEMQKITTELSLQQDWLDKQVQFTSDLVDLENDRADALERQADAQDRMRQPAGMAGMIYSMYGP